MNDNRNKISWCDATLNPIVGCPHKCNYCVDKNTLILKSDGSVVKIDEIKVGDEILSVEKGTTNYHYYTKAIVLNISKSLKSSIEITMENGIKTICSPEHRWLTRRGWKYTIGKMQGKERRPYLTLNDSINFLSTLHKPLRVTKQYIIGYLTGIIKGDGTLKKYDYSGKRRNKDEIHSFRLAMKDFEGIDRSKKYLSDFGINTLSFKFYTKKYIYPAIRTSKKEDYKKIERLIEFKSNPEFCRGFLAGIFDAEGNGCEKMIKIYNKDNKILSFIKFALKCHNFVFSTYSKDKLETICVLGGREEYIRFFQLTMPAIQRKYRIEGIVKDSIKIKSIKIIGNFKEMIDITTTTKTFIANGFISHNCYAIHQAKRQKHRCKLCYQFIPHPHLDRLNQIKPTQKPKKIFIDSMWDWNSNGIKKEWIETILNKIKECPQHIFQILSKRPIRYSRFKYPDNVWLGTSISTNKDTYRVNDLLKTNSENLKFVSVEPIHENINFYFSKINWIIIGAETGNRKGKITPKKEWIKSIIDNAKVEGIPIFIKDNINWHKKIQQYPPKPKVNYLHQNLRILEEASDDGRKATVH